MQLKAGLPSLALDVDFVDRLDGVEHPFWSTARAALVALSGRG